MSRTTRRDLLGAAGGSALAGIATVAVAKPDLPPPDAELIAIGCEAAALLDQRKPLDARWWAIPQCAGGRRAKGSPEAREVDAIAAALEPIDSRLDELQDRALLLPATTREGMAVKALLIRHELRLNYTFHGHLDLDALDPGQQLTLTLLDDLLGEPS